MKPKQIDYGDCIESGHSYGNYVVTYEPPFHFVIKCECVQCGYLKERHVPRTADSSINGKSNPEYETLLEIIKGD